MAMHIQEVFNPDSVATSMSVSGTDPVQASDQALPESPIGVNCVQAIDSQIIIGKGHPVTPSPRIKPF